MQQKKIAVINDLSGYGRCSLTVQLPVISALKVQCCPIPTTILSNHCAFPNYYIDDYTDKMQPYIDEWKKLNLKFDGICSGFLGSQKQIDIVMHFIEEFKAPSSIVIIDPVMGDNGKIYRAYNETMCARMKELISKADIITPNVTEAAILSGLNYNTLNTEDNIIKAARVISSYGPERIVITGIDDGEYISNYCYDKETTGVFIKTKKIGVPRCGTGDIFSSIIAAEAVKGIDLCEAVNKAAHFIQKCISKSIELNIPLTDGVCFEEYLTDLR